MIEEVRKQRGRRDVRASGGVRGQTKQDGARSRAERQESGGPAMTHHEGQGGAAERGRHAIFADDGGESRQEQDGGRASRTADSRRREIEEKRSEDERHRKDVRISDRQAHELHLHDDRRKKEQRGQPRPPLLTGKEPFPEKGRQPREDRPGREGDADLHDPSRADDVLGHLKHPAVERPVRVVRRERGLSALALEQRQDRRRCGRESRSRHRIPRPRTSQRTVREEAAEVSSRPSSMVAQPAARSLHS